MEIFNEGWNYKKQLSNKINNLTIEKLFIELMENGAIGGKICGAGGGGFLLLVCQQSKQNYISRKLPNYQILPFSISFEGSKIYNI